MNSHPVPLSEPAMAFGGLSKNSLFPDGTGQGGTSALDLQYVEVTQAC